MTLLNLKNSDSLLREWQTVDKDIREGRFQRGLALVTAFSGVLAGLEVAYEHYRGSYGQKVMYVPVLISPVLTAAGVAAFLSKRAAQWPLRAASIATLATGAVGFVLHIRGIDRKPGGWRLPIVNIVMGPPLFAPPLFAIGGYIGLITSYLRRADAPGSEIQSRGTRPSRATAELHPHTGSKPSLSWEQDLREGRFQEHLAVATALSAFFSGFESLYSHYKNRFQYKVQWAPIIMAPILMGASIGAIKSRRVAHTALPAASVAAMAVGGIGFYCHVRGVKRRPGGFKMPLYNVMYGPPVFAPLLFAACGFLGALASLMRREK